MNLPDIIPIFPLSKVLFPNMILPLHIYEERYKTMVKELLKGGTIFGVIPSEELKPGCVGTTARIQKVLHTYDDDRMDILAVGEDRFRLMDILDDRPYLRAKVSRVEDDLRQDTARIQIENMLGLYHRFIARLGLKQEQREQLENLVEDLDLEREISYIIGQTIGLDINRQQELLEVTDPGKRIELLTGELKRQDRVHKLARQLFEGEDFDPSLN